MIGSMVGERFGYARVSIVLGDGSPPTNCRFTIHLEPTPGSLLVEGPVFPLEREKSHKPPGRNAERLLSPLSLRERQIVKLIGKGLSDHEIAGALHLSLRTIEGHWSDRFRLPLPIAPLTLDSLSKLRAAVRQSLTGIEEPLDSAAALSNLVTSP
ncbi:MAG: LuxR C-terminal-related transcriptional regulator [Nitrospira sp.]|nr:LuxR C-terminal-related transcriptional regulator [Nitrospira sp.]